jgi:hypothetical protein
MLDVAEQQMRRVQMRRIYFLKEAVRSALKYNEDIMEEQTVTDE